MGSNLDMPFKAARCIYLLGHVGQRPVWLYVVELPQINGTSILGLIPNRLYAGPGAWTWVARVQITSDLYDNVAVHFTDGRVVRAGVSVTWNVLSWSRGHKLEPRSGRTWGRRFPTQYMLIHVNDMVIYVHVTLNGQLAGLDIWAAVQTRTSLFNRKENMCCNLC